MRIRRKGKRGNAGNGTVHTHAVRCPRTPNSDRDARLDLEEALAAFEMSDVINLTLSNNEVHPEESFDLPYSPMSEPTSKLPILASPQILT
jgi:hypothetical protein